jgi:hypothetical protein
MGASLVGGRGSHLYFNPRGERFAQAKVLAFHVDDCSRSKSKLRATIGTNLAAQV